MADSSTASSVAVSVVIPLEFDRGQALACARAWTRTQTFPRDNFQLVFAAPKALDADVEAALRACLQPWDKLVRFSCEHDIALAAEGARLADGVWLLFTEAHCIPEPRALEHLMQVAVAHPQWHGFSSATIPLTHNFLSTIEAEMYDRDIRETLAGSSWLRVLDQCFMVRREAYFQAGGFDGAYGHFAEWLLSASLRRCGFELGVDREAVLRHYYIGSLDELAEFTLDFALGHVRFLHRNPGDPRAEYFPAIPELEEAQSPPHSDWRGMLNLRCRAAPAQLWRQCKMVFKSALGRDAYPEPGVYAWRLSRDLLHGLVAGKLGRSAACVLARHSERVARRRLAKAVRRANRPAARIAMNAWFECLIRRCRLEYLQTHTVQTATQPTPVCSTRGRWQPAVAGGAEVRGFHAQESRAGRNFRWSSHCACVYLPLSAGRFRLRLDWDPIRPLAVRDLVRLEFSRRRLALREIELTRTSLAVEVACEQPGFHVLAWAMLPMPVSADPRLLGLPLYQVEWCAL